MTQLLTNLLSLQSLIIYIGVLGGILCALETRRRCEHWLKLLCVTQSGLFFLVLTICFQRFEKDAPDLFLSQTSIICNWYRTIALFSLMLTMYIVLVSMLEMDNIRTYSQILYVGGVVIVSLLFVCVMVYIKTTNQFHELYKQFYNTTGYDGVMMDNSWTRCEIKSPVQITSFAVEYLGMYIPMLMLFVVAWRMKYRARSARNQPPCDESKERRVCCVEDIPPHRCSSCDILDSICLQLFVFIIIFVIRIYLIIQSFCLGTDMQQISVPLTVINISTTVSVNVISSFILHSCGCPDRTKYSRDEKVISSETMVVATKSREFV